MSRRRQLVVAMLVSFLVPAGDALAVGPTFGERSLSEGVRGRDVRVLQDFLTRVGVRTPVDGRYGPYTARRVRTWERRADRRIDGRVSRDDARLLREQVEGGTRVLDSAATGGTAPTPPPAPAPTLASALPVAGEKAVIGPDGKAIAPASAPPAVHALIAAANEIHDKPYRYGGGHGRWIDSGYDCSGSMSYALHGAGMLDVALDSSGFMRWGEPGPGVWVTSYANPGHSFMVIAGLRFDTSGRAEDNSRWDRTMRPTAGHVVRHPPGL